MKKLTLHLGMHRCGSTSVQTFLRRNRRRLEAEGVSVILRADLKQSRASGIKKWHRRHRWDPRSWGSVERFVDEIEGLPGDHVLLSEECLIGMMPGLRNRSFYKRLDDFMAWITLLRPHFDLRIRFIVRRQDHFISSVYAFRLFRGLVEDFDSFVGSFGRAAFDWRTITTAIDRHQLTEQSHITALEAWNAGTEAQALSALFDLNVSGLEAGVHGNKKACPKALTLVLALNKAGLLPHLSLRKQRVQPLLKRPDNVSPALLTSLFSSAELASLERVFDRDAPVGFTAATQAGFLEEYREANAVFTAHSSFISGQNIWQIQ